MKKRRRKKSDVHYSYSGDPERELAIQQSLSRYIVVNWLLNELTLGDHTPRQLLPEMRQLDGHKVNCFNLCDCSDSRKAHALSWPAHDSGSLEVLSATADKVHEVPVVAEVSSISKTLDKRWLHGRSFQTSKNCEYFGFGG